MPICVTVSKYVLKQGETAEHPLPKQKNIPYTGYATMMFMSTEPKFILNNLSNFDIFGTGCQGFIQNQIIVSHACFGGHMDVNC